MTKLNYCTYIRVLAMMSIILCHLVPHHSNPYVQMSAHVFVIGVPIFFFLSGFLFGLQGQITSVWSWYKKRLKRIYIPWFLFVVVLASIHLIKGNDILTWNWVKLLLGIQGTIVGVEGAGHTWFITGLLLCYLATPLLYICYTKVKPTRTILTLLCIPTVLSLFSLRTLVLLGPVCWFGIAYILGQMYDERVLTWRNGIIALGFALCCFSLRLLVRHVTDDAFWYDKLCVTYTQYFTAGGLMFFIAVLFRNSRLRPFSRYVSDISFELYLYHYMLCAGPISIFAAQLPWIYSSLTIVACSFGMASIAHYISLNFIKIRRRNRQVRA